MTQKPLVEQHDPRWSTIFKTEVIEINSRVPDINLHHIGSTSIPSIYAKPIIDMLGETERLADIDGYSAALVEYGYESLGEFGIARRRYFRKDIDGVRRFHLHCFEKGSSGFNRHIAFRDYLIAHPDEAKRYSDLKQRLVERYPNDIDAYIDGKESLVVELEKAAVEWKENPQDELD